MCPFFKKNWFVTSPEDRDLVFTVEVVYQLFHDSSSRLLCRAPWEVVVVETQKFPWAQAAHFQGLQIGLNTTFE